MRRGRAADRADDWGDAYTSLSAAVEAFRDAAAVDPGSARTLGNWGNALLQLGQVRVTKRTWIRVRVGVEFGVRVRVRVAQDRRRGHVRGCTRGCRITWHGHCGV